MRYGESRVLAIERRWNKPRVFQVSTVMAGDEVEEL
jgi:hypothetical protein